MVGLGQIEFELPRREFLDGHFLTFSVSNMNFTVQIICSLTITVHLEVRILEVRSSIWPSTTSVPLQEEIADGTIFRVALSQSA
jgi:hypothetical protein